MIKDSTRIIIFGAGFYARKLYEYLYFRNMTDLIQCFVVTDRYKNPDSIFGIPVISKYELKNDTEGFVIYIAVSEGKSHGIKEELERDGYTNIELLNRNFIDNVNNETIRICNRLGLQHNKIFFDVFDGRGYCCNCKYIAEELIKEDQDVDIVWNFAEKSSANFPNRIRKVMTETPEYYKEIYTSGIVVTNNSLPYQIKKRVGQYWISTWHGIGPTKKVAIDINANKEDYQGREITKNDRARYDLMIAGSDFCEKLYRSAFQYAGEIAKYGYPRNDIIINRINTKKKIVRKYGIEYEKRIVLYAPTFRYSIVSQTDRKKAVETYDINMKMVLGQLCERFGGEYLLLYRIHHRVRCVLDLNGLFPDGIDVTDYEDMQELLCAADVLITDYSSSMWDFSLARKPVFLYFNDKEECEKRTGFYRDPDTYPYPKGHTTEELCQAIREFDDEKYQKNLDEWFETYGTYDDGHASERVAERIIDVIEHPEKYGNS